MARVDDQLVRLGQEVDELRAERDKRAAKFEDLRGRYPEQRAHDLEHAFYWKRKHDELEADNERLRGERESLRNGIELLIRTYRMAPAYELAAVLANATPTQEEP